MLLPQRLVLDTNVWLDWLLFADPDAGPLKAAAAAGRVEIYVDAATEAELIRVLDYSFGVRRLDAAAQAACLAECRRAARVWLPTSGAPAPASSLPVCADPDDQKFLDLALACGAQFLVTRDHDLLELARWRDPLPPFGIVTPRQWRAVCPL